jgi:uncharacterized membrane protein
MVIQALHGPIVVRPAGTPPPGGQSPTVCEYQVSGCDARVPGELTATTLEETGMSTITQSIDVEVPVTTAYNQWTQFESFPQFMEGVQEIRQLDDTHLHWVVKVGGATREFDATVTEQHPDERVAWKSVSGPEHAGVVTFHKLNSTTSRVTAQMDIDPDGFLEKVGDKFGVIEGRVKGDLERFKDFIENRGGETGAWRGDVPR